MATGFPTVNRDYRFVNINKCTSFNMVVTTSLAPLTGLHTALSGQPANGQPCGEVTIWNRSGGDVTIYDQDEAATMNGFVLEDNDQFTFMGITNVVDVSAVGAGTGLIYYRTQFYSHNPSK